MPTESLNGPTNQELEVLGKMCLQAALLRNDKPTETENEFSSVNDKGQGEVILQNSRYKNRARPSFQVNLPAFLFDFLSRPILLVDLHSHDERRRTRIHWPRATC